MFKLSLYLLANVIAYAFALHNFLPINDAAAKKNVYTNFVPPSAERFFTAGAPPSAKAIAPAPAPQLIPAAANAPYLGPYAAYQTQYPPYPYRQQYPTPYYPGVFYPPVQQFVYPGAVGPSPVVYVPRYPVPAESGSEQGGSAGGAGGWGSYFPSNWQSWGSNWGSYFPSWPGSGGSESAEGGAPSSSAEGASSQAGASPASSSNRGKPEKIEATESPAPAPASSHDSAKQDSDDKNAVTVELPEQQYVLLGQPQFFGQLAAFPTDRDPTTLNGAAKGAVSSFLFYKDQSQQVVPQRFNEISNVPGSASLAYQRFLLLSKQRSEDGPKPANTSESLSSTSTPQNQSSSSSANTQKDVSSQASSTNSTSAAAITSQTSSAKPSGSSSN